MNNSIKCFSYTTICTRMYAILFWFIVQTWRIIKKMSLRILFEFQEILFAFVFKSFFVLEIERLNERFELCLL